MSSRVTAENKGRRGGLKNRPLLPSVQRMWMNISVSRCPRLFFQPVNKLFWWGGNGENGMTLLSGEEENMKRALERKATSQKPSS